MKIDYDKKHPFTSVDLIYEGKEDEYLTEEQTEEFKKIGLRCVRISYCCLLFSVLSLICEFTDKAFLQNASGFGKILAIVGYAGLGCLIISIAFLFVCHGKLAKLTKEYEDEADRR